MSRTKRVVITGAPGMLGQALLSLAPETVTPIGVGRRDGDLATLPGVHSAIVEKQPDVVIHCAAWTDVNGCEQCPSKAFRDNALATRLVADACARLRSRLVLISTDYVFDGTARRPYREDDLPSPINIYGETKQLAEQAARKVPDHLIVRTQWLIGPGRNNFVSAVVQAAREGRELRVIADQWGCPTYTRHLAAVLWELALADFRGVVHAAGDGVATWWDVAEAALAAAGLNVLPEKIALEDWPAAARRPRYCVLDCSRLSEWLGRSLPPWRQGVGEYVRDFL